MRPSKLSNQQFHLHLEMEIQVPQAREGESGSVAPTKVCLTMHILSASFWLPIPRAACEVLSFLNLAPSLLTPG
jgi:hypothetical protein